MSAPLRGRRQSGRDQEDVPLSEFPGWGLDIMMALYGRETIQRARAADVEARLPEPAYVDVEPLSPLQAELEAMNALYHFLQRRFRRR